MFGSVLIEKMLGETSLSIFENENNYEIVSNSNEVLFQIHKESLSINLYFDAWELVAKGEEKICNTVLSVYLKLNYLVQNGLFRILIEGNTTSVEWNNSQSVQNSLRFFKDIQVDKSQAMTGIQVQIMSVYGTKKHHTFNRF
jgi:hypothetical protein